MALHSRRTTHGLQVGSQRCGVRPSAHPCIAGLLAPWQLRRRQVQPAHALDSMGSRDQYSGSWPAGMASAPQMSQQQQYQQQFPQQPYQQKEDTEFLWAGYSDLSEQLRKLHQHHETVVSRLHELEAKLKHAQQQPTVSTWQAATFLLFFMAFINFIGMLTTFNPWMFLPWAAKSPAVQSTLYVKQVLGFVLPLTNTLVVLIFCMQAIKAAWACLKW